MSIFEVLALLNKVKPIYGEVEDAVLDQKLTLKEVVEIIDTTLKQFLGAGMDKIYIDLKTKKIIIDLDKSNNP